MRFWAWLALSARKRLNSRVRQHGSGEFGLLADVFAGHRQKARTQRLVPFPGKPCNVAQCGGLTPGLRRASFFWCSTGKVCGDAPAAAFEGGLVERCFRGGEKPLRVLDLRGVVIFVIFDERSDGSDSRPVFRAECNGD